MIEVVIDELVVRGLSTGDAQAVAAALEERLAALARDGELAPRADVATRAGPVLAPAGNPTALGAALAAAVWSAVCPGSGR